MGSLINELSSFSNNFIPIQKLFYKKYAYKITIDTIALGLESPTFRSVPKSRRSNFQYFNTEGRKRLQNLLDACEIDVKVRIETFQSGLYFVNEIDAVSVAKWLRPFIKNVSAPTTAQVFNKLKSDSKVRVRSSLFLSKYRWSVQCGLTTKETDDNMDQWLIDNDIMDRCTISYNWKRKLYFNKEEDVILFKMVFSEIIYQIEQAVLHEELN